MDDNSSLKILESYVEIDKLHDEINNKIFNFISKGNELVNLSDDNYQIEKSLKLNKISLKDYILNSPCCVSLSENNISNYSIDELKNYLNKYEKNFNQDCYKYYLAISLYELAEEIEKLVDSKITLELNKLSEIILDINNINSVDKSEYEIFYTNLKNILDKYLDDNKLTDKTYNISIQILNDIFNFYINGYPDIPFEYLYHNDNL